MMPRAASFGRKNTIQGSGILQAVALTLDDNQRIYLGGSLSGTAVFDGINLVSSEWGSFSLYREIQYFRCTS